MSDDHLHSALTDRGATWAPFAGISVVTHFGDPGREWRAAREGCAVFPAGYRHCLVATGEDRVAFLQGLLSNDVKRLTAGQGVYAASLTQTGKVVSDLRVYADPDRLLLDLVAWRADALRTHLQRFLVADDVELGPCADAQPLLQLQGPFASAVAGEALGLDLLPTAPLAHVRLSFDGSPVRVVRVAEGGADGVLICGPASAAGPLLDACRAAGAAAAGMEALNALRIEAGSAWAGVDMDEETLLLETGCEAAASFTKGCYLGQEVVERIAARGHVNRRLAGLLLEGAALPARGTALMADGRDVGYVTSSVRSPLLGRGIALAIIHRKHGVAGTRLQIGADGESGIVTALPFDGALRQEEDGET